MDDVTYYKESDMKICESCGNQYETPFCSECGLLDAEDAAYKEQEPDWSKYECKGCGTLGCYGGCNTMDFPRGGFFPDEPACPCCG